MLEHYRVSPDTPHQNFSCVFPWGSCRIRTVPLDRVFSNWGTSFHPLVYSSIFSLFHMRQISFWKWPETFCLLTVPSSSLPTYRYLLIQDGNYFSCEAAGDRAETFERTSGISPLLSSALAVVSWVTVYMRWKLQFLADSSFCIPVLSPRCWCPHQFADFLLSVSSHLYFPILH